MKYERIGREHCLYGLTKENIAFMDMDGHFNAGRPSISILIDDPVAIESLSREGATLTPKVVDSDTGREMMKLKLNIFTGEKVDEDTGIVWPNVTLRHPDGHIERIYPEGRRIFNDNRAANNIAELSIVFKVRESLKYKCMTCSIDEFCMTIISDGTVSVEPKVAAGNILNKYYQR